jgi:hypothetical protein
MSSDNPLVLGLAVAIAAAGLISVICVALAY